VKVERRTWVIDDGGATIELVLDRGEVGADDRASAICEIELELKSGNAAALFALARRIDAIAPVRLGVLTKAERGYRLREPIALASKAEPLTLDRDMTAAQAFQNIIWSCIRQFRLNEEVLTTDRNADALHQARVALRRLRSAFSIFKSLIGGDAGAALREELRWLASEFGDARNLDVLRKRSKPGALHDRIEAARERAYDHAEEVLASPRARALMLDLAEWTASGDWLDGPDTEADGRQPSRQFAVTALDRFRRKVKKGGRDLGGADDHARHEVRKDVKKLRYATDFFAGLFDGKREKRRHKRFIAALQDIQDRLGALNDLATAPQMLEKLGLADDPDASRLLASGKKKTLLIAAADAHDELMDIKHFWR
jgi:inorganic triphosphatase YgiF